MPRSFDELSKEWNAEDRLEYIRFVNRVIIVDFGKSSNRDKYNLASSMQMVASKSVEFLNDNCETLRADYEHSLIALGLTDG